MKKININVENIVDDNLTFSFFSLFNWLPLFVNKFRSIKIDLKLNQLWIYSKVAFCLILSIPS